MEVEVGILMAKKKPIKKKKPNPYGKFIDSGPISIKKKVKMPFMKDVPNRKFTKSKNLILKYKSSK